MKHRHAIVVFVVAASTALALFAARLMLGVTHGLRAEYFASASIGGPPAFTTVDSTISTAQMNERWNGSPPEAFAVRWTGYLSMLHRDTRTFTLISDDGSRLWIDGRLTIDDDGGHGAVAKRATVDLDRGEHFVVIEYTQLGGIFELSWMWNRGENKPTAVPAWLLTPTHKPLRRIVAARAIEISAVAALGLALFIAAKFGFKPTWDAAAMRPRAAALVFFAALTVVETWPLASNPAHLSRNDNGDAMLNEWVIAWVAHEAPRAPAHLFDANIFYPERHTLGYAEAMIVQSAFAAPVLWLGGSPVLAYNLVLLLGFALSGWAMYVAIAGWTGDQLAGLAAGVLFAFSAQSLTRLPHLQAQHTEFFPFALVALDAFLRLPGLRSAVRLSLWFTLQALTSIYLLVITATALIAAAAARPREWRGHRFQAAAGYALVAAATAALLLLPLIVPYWQLYHGAGLTRSLDDVARLSATWRDYLSTPSRLQYQWWSYRWFSGSALFPGMVGLALAGIAVGTGTAFSDPRARMCLIFGIVGVLLSLGTNLPGFVTLYRLVTPLHAIRAVNRFGFLANAAVAVLAGFGMADLKQLTPSSWNAAVRPAIVALAVVETFSGPLQLVRFDGIPRIYDALRGQSGVVAVELPFYGPAAAFAQARYMLDSTRLFEPILNGYAGFFPESYRQNVEELSGFPDERSIVSLRRQHVTHVFVRSNEMLPDVVARADATSALERVASDGSIVLYRLRP